MPSAIDNKLTSTVMLIEQGDKLIIILKWIGLNYNFIFSFEKIINELFEMSIHK